MDGKSKGLMEGLLEFFFPVHFRITWGWLCVGMLFWFPFFYFVSIKVTKHFDPKGYSNGGSDPRNLYDYTELGFWLFFIGYIVIPLFFAIFNDIFVIQKVTKSGNQIVRCTGYK